MAYPEPGLTRFYSEKDQSLDLSDDLMNDLIGDCIGFDRKLEDGSSSKMRSIKTEMLYGDSDLLKTNAVSQQLFTRDELTIDHSEVIGQGSFN